MKAESDAGAAGDQLAKSKSEIIQMFLQETETLRASYREMDEGEINESTKKEAVLASLHSLRLFTVKKSVEFLNPEGLYARQLFQYVTELGAAIDNIEAAYIKKEEADIEESTKKEAVLHPLDILWKDLHQAIEDVE